MDGFRDGTYHDQVQGICRLDGSDRTLQPLTEDVDRGLLRNLLCGWCDDRNSYFDSFRSNAVKELIEAQGKVFKETKPNRWRYFYPADRYYLDTLQDFILNEKPIIDKYLSSHVESGIPLADKELDASVLFCLSHFP